MVNILLSYYNFHEEWAKDTIKKYINHNDKVVVISFAFSEYLISNKTEWHRAYNRHHGVHYKRIIKPFIEFGIDEDNIIWLNYFEDPVDYMKKVIENSNIVYLTGGLPEKAIERVVEKGLVNYLDQSKTIIGVSAGALMQLDSYSVSPDEDYPEFAYFKGLGLIDNNFYIEVHYNDTDIQNDCIRRVLKEKTDTVYGITDYGGIIVDNGHISLLGDVVTFKNN